MGHVRALLLASCASLVLPVAADAITVTTFDDENGSNSGACSLREAVTAINNAADFGGCTFSAGDTLVQLGTGTYLLQQSGRVDIDAPMTIAGGGVASTIIARDAAGSLDDDMLFVDLQVPGTVNFHGFTVTGSTPGSFGFNSAINYLANTGSDFVMTDVTVRDNALGGTAAFRIQGNTSATAELTRVIFQNNVGDGSQSFAEGGGMFCRAGGSSSIPVLTLTDVIFSQNTALAVGGGSGALGGGLGSEGCSLTLKKVTFDRNTVSADVANGGGLLVTDYAGSTTAVSLVNVTFSGNSAKTGGGLFEGLSFSGGGSGFSVTMKNVTFAGDTASIAGAHLYQDSTAASVKNVLFGPTSGSNCAGNPAPSLTLQGGNMDADGTCGTEMSNGSPGLAGALADNGGFTPTLALTPGGAAVDAGTNAGAPVIDQRGQARPQDGDGDGTATTDIGAFELVGGAVTPVEVPAAGPWGLVTLVLALAGVGVVALRLRAHP